MRIQLPYRFSLLSIVWAMLMLCSCETLWAQKSDTLNIAKNDTIPIKKSEFDTIVTYKAEDSIRFDVKKMLVIMYGKSEILYDDIKLESSHIELDWQKNTLSAIGVKDTAGIAQGSPIFTDKGQTYKAQEIKYNFKSQRALVKGVYTEQGEGFLHGERIKKDDKNQFFVKNGLYTTCNDPHPHFGIRSKKIKMRANKEIISGPFNLEVSDIPTPIGFPFGFVPIPKDRSSGVILPNYGETKERGFFLRDGGYYWAISDYIDLVALGEIYSRGGYGLSLNSRYKKRYHFNGNFSFSYNSRPSGEKGTINYQEAKDFWIRWSHTPTPRGTGRFSASVNAGSTSYNKRYSQNTQNFISPTFNSSVSYTKTFTGKPFNFSSSLRHNQNVQTKEVTLSPQMSFGVTNIQPFKNIVKGQNSILKKLNMSYSFNARGDYTNKIRGNTTSFKLPKGEVHKDTLVPFDFAHLDTMLSTMRYGAQHSIPISTSFTAFKYFTVSQGASYTEVWYKERYKYRWVNKDTVDVDTIRGFSRYYQYSVNVSVATRLYNTVYFKSNRIEAIRHTMIPTVSLNYAPDFSNPKYGFYQSVRTDDKGTYTLLPTIDGLMGKASAGKQGNMSFSLNNNIEMKVRKPDNPEGKAEKISLIDNFSISGGYNFLADSFNLSDISMSFRTNLFKKINISINSSLDPYTYELISVDEKGNVKQRHLSKYAWQTGNGIGNLQNIGVALSTSINPAVFKKKVQGTSGKSDTKTPNTTNKGSQNTQNWIDYINVNRDLYVDFSVPWNMNISFNYNYTKQGFQNSKNTKSLTLSGDVSLTPKWKVSVSTGYDFESKKVSFTNVNIHRDMHCWQMSLNWIPFGDRQSYTFNLGVKASVLQDLKLIKRNNWYDRQ